MPDTEIPELYDRVLTCMAAKQVLHENPHFKTFMMRHQEINEEIIKDVPKLTHIHRKRKDPTKCDKKRGKKNHSMLTQHQKAQLTKKFK